MLAQESTLGSKGKLSRVFGVYIGKFVLLQNRTVCRELDPEDRHRVSYKFNGKLVERECGVGLQNCQYD